jgi:hypothetical protein
VTGVARYFAACRFCDSWTGARRPPIVYAPYSCWPAGRLKSTGVAGSVGRRRRGGGVVDLTGVAGGEGSWTGAR